MRNFKSYGDYETKIDLGALGPVLIMGEIRGNTSKSNGAGKSTISDALIWCLFGRLPAKAKPAGHVVNNTIGKDCEVTVISDGYTITRTRNKEGHHDLLIKGPDGQDITDSTNTNAQKHLNKLFNLDYDIFTSNVFFTQVGQSFLELPDQKRKKAMERMLHLNRFDYYVDVAKEHITKETEKQTKLLAALESVEQEVLRISKQIERNNDLLKEHEEERKKSIEEKRAELLTIDGKYKNKVEELQEQQTQAKKDLEQIQTYDLSKIEKQWEGYKSRLEKLEQTKGRLQLIRDEIVRLTTQKESLEKEEDNKADEEILLLEQKLKDKVTQLAKMDTHNIPELEKEWAKYNTNQKLLEAANEKLRQQEIKLTRITSLLNVEQAQIDEWKKKAGEICPNCKQKISEEHSLEMCEPSKEKLEELEKKKKALETTIRKIKKLRDVQSGKICEPSISITEANLHNANREEAANDVQIIKDEITRWRTSAKDEIEKRKKQLEDTNTELDNKIKYVSEREKKIEDAEALIEKGKPTVTIKEAEARKAQYDAQLNKISMIKTAINNVDEQKQKEKDNIKDDIKEMENEENPYKTVVDGLHNDLNEVKERRSGSQAKVDALNKIIKHYNYIRAAYSDRKRIKAHILSKLIPYFNERIAYYMDSMDVECDLKFTSSLQVKYGLRPYEMWSGGERKKIDLALMFAIHDLHTSMYDQQCNIMMFDEVDGRLDQDGVEKFVEIIFNEVATRCSTVPVISHKDSMRDAFPTKIIVRKNEEDFSFIEEVR